MDTPKVHNPSHRNPVTHRGGSSHVRGHTAIDQLLGDRAQRQQGKRTGTAFPGQGNGSYPIPGNLGGGFVTIAGNTGNAISGFIARLLGRSS